MGRACSAACLGLGWLLGFGEPLSAQELTIQLGGGPRTFLIAPHLGESCFPGMPSIPGRLAGGRDLEGAEFLWKAEVAYRTRQRNPLLLHDAFEARAMGCPWPALLFRFPAAAGHPNHGLGRDSVRGGEVRVAVMTARTGPGRGEGASLGPLSIRLGDQPDRARVEERLRCGPEIFPDGTQVTEEALTRWLRAIACQESGLRQNATRNDPAQYQSLGEPNMNRHGDGGIGIMQRTPFGVEREARGGDILNWLWDWTANADEGKRLFREEKLRNSAYRYPAQLARSEGFARALEATNRHRERLGLGRLRRIRIPPLGAEALLLDAVRGYNGYAGRDPFGLRLHEFRLKTRPTDFGLSLEVAGEGPDPEAAAQSMAWAVWEQVPALDRPVEGDRAYVDHVRARVDQPCAD